MADWNLKRGLRNVPQPYKTWIARTILPFFFAIGVPFVAVIESAGWCKEMAGKVADAWRDVRTW